ncbi:hypothetical protein Ciccas_000794 [Cichlidogyrus casuarinus]|uniref:Uncharacterized protein n=1 Tax=Cichlidogyrus casuarinus TaxID=1844966 RepID=A0ABD2QLV9_9PLAT
MKALSFHAPVENGAPGLFSDSETMTNTQSRDDSLPRPGTASGVYSLSKKDHALATAAAVYDDEMVVSLITDGK